MSTNEGLRLFSEVFEDMVEYPLSVFYTLVENQHYEAASDVIPSLKEQVIKFKAYLATASDEEEEGEEEETLTPDGFDDDGGGPGPAEADIKLIDEEEDMIVDGENGLDPEAGST